MRKIFTLFTLCLLATAAWGQTTIEFIAGETVGNNQTASGADEMTISPVKISTTSGGFNCKQGEQYQYRFAKNSENTIETLDGSVITEIKFTCTVAGDAQYGPGNFDGDGYTFSEKIGTWKGAANKVVLKAVTAQVRAIKIEVTITGGGLVAPTITPAGGTYYAPVEVTISCPTAGASIYYTTNGSTPNTSSTKYTAPFTVSTNTTVKAISAKDGETSGETSAVYEFATATPVPNIRAYQGLDDGTMVTFTNPVSVLAQSGQRMFVKDNTGYALFYGNTGQTYKNGDVIPAGFAGEKTTWDGEPELQKLTGFQPASSNSPIAAEYPFSASDVNHDHFGHFVAFKNATITKDGNNYRLTDEFGNECPIFFGSMGVSAPTDLNAKYNVDAIVGSYGKNTVWQLLAIKLEKVGGDTPPPGEGVTLADLYEIATNATGSSVVLKNDAIVLGQVGKYLYLKDTERGFGLVYGTIGQTYKPGDVMPAGYGGQVKIYDMEAEIYDSFTGFQPAKDNIGGQDALEKAAEKITISQVGHDTWGHYVKIDNVTINTTDKTFSDATGSIGYYDRFAIQWPEDETKTYTIYAIVGSFKTNYQLLPTRIVFEEEIPDVEDLEELYQLSKGKLGHFIEPLTAVYQNKTKRDLYIIDSKGVFGLVYGDVDGNFDNGDIINDAVASWTTYNDNLQLTPKADTFVPASHGTPVEPEMMPVEEISQDLIHNFLAFENVGITSRVEVVNDKEQTNFYLFDDTGEIMLYDRYELGVADLDPSKTYDIKGFLTIFSKNRIMEIYPIEIKEHGTTEYPVGDLDMDGEVSVSDVNIMIDILLSGTSDADLKKRADVAYDGEITIADLNVLIDIILNKAS